MSEKDYKSIVNKKRENLGEVLPIATPYTVFIDPCNVCNFKCNFCAPQNRKEDIDFFRGLMPIEMYKKIIDDISEMPQRLKMLRLYTMGEPLLHPKFSEMVAYAKEKKVSDYIETVTNGSMLNKELNRKLADSGIDRIRISIEALSAEEYKQIAGVDIDFGEFVNNIEDLYNVTRGKCEIYIKTVDVSVNTEEKKDKFNQIFKNISDKLFVESIAPVWPDFDELNDQYQFSGEGLMGTKVDKTIQCCPFVFYGCVINPDGEVTTCCADWKRGYSYGNIKEKSFKDIWYGDKMKVFWKVMLNGKKDAFSSCRKCEYINYVANENIDKYVREILARIE